MTNAILIRHLLVLAATCFTLLTLAAPFADAQTAADVVRSVTISAPRDMGYFVGDLVNAEVELVVAREAAIETASLPHPGPITYWLDLRSIDVTEHTEGSQKRYVLKLLYQDFYDALDARQQEIPAFSVLFKIGSQTVTADVSAWTIGVSSLREIAPPPKDDPKDYLKADEAAPFIKTCGLWQATVATMICALLALGALAYDRVWWPFRQRASRPFADAVARLRRLRGKEDTDENYLEALLILHRSIDCTNGQRVLADDVSAFLHLHPAFAPLSESILRFFTVSRQAFFKSDAAGSRHVLPFSSLESLARQMAEAERSRA